MAEGSGSGQPQAGRHRQHRHACLGYDTLADRPDSPSVESPTLVTPYDNHIGTDRLRVQQDDLRGVTVLNPVRELDLCLFGPPPEARLQGEALSPLTVEGLLRRDRLNDDELGAVTLGESECIVERTTRWAEKSTAARTRERSTMVPPKT